MSCLFQGHTPKLCVFLDSFWGAFLGFDALDCPEYLVEKPSSGMCLASLMAGLGFWKLDPEVKLFLLYHHQGANWHVLL